MAKFDLNTDSFFPGRYTPNFTIAVKEKLWRCNTCNFFLSAKKVYKGQPVLVQGQSFTYSCYHCNEPLWRMK